MPDTTQEKTFFEDLIDRRFFQFIGTYLGVSFGLIQFAEFMENRYSPGFQLVDKMIIFLAVLLPAVIVFIYNHGRKGRDKWKPFERIFLPSNLVVALGMALFFFNSPPAGAATETVSIASQRSGSHIGRKQSCPCSPVFRRTKGQFHFGPNQLPIKCVRNRISTPRCSASPTDRRK